jgi:transposase
MFWSANMPTTCPFIAKLRSTAARALIHWLAGHVYMPEKLDRSTLADWVGRAAFELRPVFDALMANLKRSTKLFMDETRAPVLDPGSKKTKTGYFWALARDDRPWGDAAPSGVAFTYAPGRGGLHAERILQGFGGVLQVP